MISSNVNLLPEIYITSNTSGLGYLLLLNLCLFGTIYLMSLRNRKVRLSDSFLAEDAVPDPAMRDLLTHGAWEEVEINEQNVGMRLSHGEHTIYLNHPELRAIYAENQSISVPERWVMDGKVYEKNANKFNLRLDSGALYIW